MYGVDRRDALEYLTNTRQLKENIEATIIENTNYYYKVTFTDEDGVQREGYVAKRNLKIIKEPEAEETEEKLPPEE